MLVMFHCIDKSDQQQTRINTLIPHLTWVENNMESIKVAGPLLEGENNKIIGSLYILEAHGINNAHKILEHDPYYKAGIWKKIITTEFKGYAGTWVGGKNWPNASSN